MKKNRTDYSMPKREFVLDAEFELLFVPLSLEEQNQLEKKILFSNHTEPVCVWNNLVIDGYYTYLICQKHHLKPNLEYIDFANREQVIEWICNRQLATFQDIPRERYKYLIGKKYLTGKKLYRGNVTTLIISKEFQINPSTVHKYSVYTKHMDHLLKSHRFLVKQILDGVFKIPIPRLEELDNCPNCELDYYETWLKEHPNSIVTYTQLKYVYCKERRANIIPKATPRAAISNSCQNPPKIIPEIKKMPQYDPDADISSLTLTIPSWISSIERTKKVTDLTKNTIEGKKRLIRQLYNLRSAIDDMIIFLKGEQPNE